MMTNVKPEPSKAKKAALQMIVGGIFGGFGMVALLEYLPAAKLSGDEIALAGAGGIYLFIGLLMLPGLFAPKLGAKLLNVEDQEDLLEQRRILAGSAIICIIWGAAQILLLVSGPGAFLPAWAGVAFMAIAMILGVGIWYRDRHLYDELIWDVTLKASYICFVGLWIVFSIWCAAAMADLLSAPSPAAILALFSGGYLLATFVAAGQRGLLETK